MNASVSANGKITPVFPATPVMVLYDDAPSAQRARLLFERLKSGVDCEVEFALKFWPFEMLLLPSVQSIALTEALAARFVVVSVGETSAIPAGVGSWLRSWARSSSGRHAALVALSPLSGKAGGVGDWLAENLRAFAEEQGVTFLPESELGVRLAAQIYQQGLSKREHAVTATLKPAMDRQDNWGYRHWGLNE
jgi:hypothetical protein